MSSSTEFKIKHLVILIDEDDRAKITSRPWTILREPVQQIIGRVKVGAVTKRITLERFLLSPPDGIHVIRRRECALNDYRKEAFLLLTMAERQAYIGKRKADCTSRFKGVYKPDDESQWRASIRPNGKSIALGSFETEEEAARAYDEAAALYFGDQAFRNLG
ncbi:MAG: hypothetical protein EOP05_03615 [Proteobacteria bacterium]|nr:MAG: hypothetical protein EOP05_03615 [Pseudomonadota bacterium]